LLHLWVHILLFKHIISHAKHVLSILVVKIVLRVVAFHWTCSLLVYIRVLSFAWSQLIKDCSIKHISLWANKHWSQLMCLMLLSELWHNILYWLYVLFWLRRIFETSSPIWNKNDSVSIYGGQLIKAGLPILFLLIGIRHKLLEVKQYLISSFRHPV
jgi:hypothetical protein